MPPGIANVDVVPATDVTKFPTYRHSGCQGQEHPGGNKDVPHGTASASSRALGSRP
jgi:hypothetical protein